METPVLLSQDSLGMIGTPVVYAEDMRYPKTVVIPDGFGGVKEVTKYPIVWLCRQGNTFMDAARVNALVSTFNQAITSPPTVVSYGYGGVGNDATDPTDATLLHLKSELITGTARKALVSIDDDALVLGDIVSDVVGSNRKRINVKYVYPQVDGLNGATFAEFALFSVQTLPGSPTGTSGVMGARFVPATAFTKDPSFKVTMNWIMRS